MSMYVQYMAQYISLRWKMRHAAAVRHFMAWPFGPSYAHTHIFTHSHAVNSPVYLIYIGTSSLCFIAESVIRILLIQH